MSVFEVQPTSLPNGEFAAAWFDDESALWDDDRLHKARSLIEEWRAPSLRLFRPERGATDVLFNPNAIAVSERVREELRRFSGVEFLPIAIEDCGSAFFVVHVTVAVEPLQEFSVRRAPPPSGNIVELFEFPTEYTPPADFFRVRQPTDSAAGPAGYCLRRIYVSDAGARALSAACGAYLEARPLRRASALRSQ